jgi:transcription-repair coupling factor (superfamily II helicase)
MNGPFSILAADPAIQGLARELSAGKRIVATGVAGSSASWTAAALARASSRHVILLVAHIDDADEVLDELTSLDLPVLRLAALEVLPGETSVSPDQLAERLATVKDVLALPAKPTAEQAHVIVCPIQSLMQLVPAISRLEAIARTLETGKDYPLASLTRWLSDAGYKRVEAIDEPGDFAIRGGILDIFPPGNARRDAGKHTPKSNANSGGGGGGLSIATGGVPVRLDFFGGTLEKISEIDLDTMGSDRAVSAVELSAATAEAAQPDDKGSLFLDLLPRECVGIIVETMEVVEQGRGYFERVTDAKGIVGPPAVLKAMETRLHALAELNQFSAGGHAADSRHELPVSPLPSFSSETQDAVKDLAALTQPPESARVVVHCQNEGELQRLGELLDQYAPEQRSTITGVEHYLHRGFLWRGAMPSQQSTPSTIAVVPYHELLNRFTVRRRSARLRSSRAMDTFLDFEPGNYVVHAEHGIALFSGLTLMKPRELPGQHGIKAQLKGREVAVEPEEYLTLEFAGKSKLHVPATQIDKVQKYIGGFSGKPPLSTLGGNRWKAQKERVSESVRDLAAELLRVRAARGHLPGVQYPPDTAWQKEFEAEFPYDETEDQLAALAEIKRDMQGPQPMDRLICGDVGFGKTELAIRAAFKACEFGKQVAVLVPTTVLAEQHERTFRSRFAGYPFKIESLSRFKTGAEVTDILKRVQKGQVDVLVGTHRILSKDVNFADLGLVVVDEEQRFGVEHKEELLRMRLTVDVLTLSATPIPRTLHMAMLGIRDISSLTTAPLDRRAIVTEVIPYNERRVQQAIARELSRDGKVFVVHNKVHDILSFADQIQKLAPDARIVVGHGQMPPHDLEEVMLRFMKDRRDGGADILVSTTIIESGIDIASANTMLIDGADKFGLADLHQLRGRVGRSKHRAYCYLLLPPDRNVKEVAQKRLKAIEQYSMLGAGFKIAMRDLEIRGAGNILGPEPSGHIAAVGYEMYCRLLEDAVHGLKNERPPTTGASVAVELGITGTIPKAYIPSDARRLEAYRRIATATSLDQLNAVRTDLTAAYGEPPATTQRLLDLAELRSLVGELQVSTVTIRERDVIFVTSDAQRLASTMQRVAPGAKPPEGTVRIVPRADPAAGAEVYFRPPENYLEPATLLRVLRHRLAPKPAATGPTSSSVSNSATKPSTLPAPVRASVPGRRPS